MPVSDMFAANGSRTPAAIVLEDVALSLPVVTQQAEFNPAPGPVPAPAQGDGKKPKKDKPTRP